MLRTLVFDRSARARWLVRGDAAMATMDGLVTNAVASMRPGDGMRAAVLTPKGKIVAEVLVLALARDAVWMDTGAAAAPGLRSALAKYVNPRFARIEEVTDSTGALVVAGSHAEEMVAGVTGAPRDALVMLQEYSHLQAPLAASDAFAVKLPSLDARGDAAFQIVAPRDACARAAAALAAAGAVRGDDTLWEQLRVARGAPAWGTDIDESTLAQEANVDERRLVSYTKGCYIGQETVARVHFRGHVNRSLRRVSLDADVVPPPGTALIDDTLGTVGDMRSAAYLPGGGAVGIAMVRREIADGATLRARWEENDVSVLVSEKAKGAID